LANAGSHGQMPAGTANRISLAMPSRAYRSVNDLWDDANAPADPVDRLVYRSNLLGSDQRITNTGGGNTSSKVQAKHPISGQTVEVMWVKGSGGDLRTATKSNFASLDLATLRSLEAVYRADPAAGPKTPIEDRMVDLYRHTAFNLNPTASSIDTPLHGLLPARHVDHMHPNAVISIAASANAAELTKKVYGDDVIHTPWQRPGFDLGLVMRDVSANHPDARGIVMGQHGLINWADDDKVCYHLTLDLIEKASLFVEAHDKGDKTFGGAKYKPIDDAARQKMLLSILPWLRGKLSAGNRGWILTLQQTPAVMRFVDSADAARLAELGTSCPDHFLRTKIKPLYVPWDPATGDSTALQSAIDSGLIQYRADYTEYYNSCKRPDSPAMRDPNPTVVLIPGLGMIAAGKTKSESRVTAEFYTCAIEVMRGAEAIDKYVALPRQEAFDIEYWALEEAKLLRMPAERELARRVVAVVGAGSGIGKSVATRLAKEGAHVVCVDMAESAAAQTADELTKTYGKGIGVAGTGVSGCGPATAVAADITKRDSIRAAFDHAILAYGGLDHLVVTAGIFVPPDEKGNIPDDRWGLTFNVNVTGLYFAAKEAAVVFDRQQTPATVVLTTSVNAVVAKKGSVAYDTSKAAANHLVRELAVELAPRVRVNAVAPATVVSGSAMFPRDRVIASLAKYELPYTTEESTEVLRDRLAEFYAKRTLTRQPITPADQAEAVWFLLSSASSKTTGQVLHVDGGLVDAFLR
jgi:rhamnulose-1-phosphate aldolase/alcohol dehydrogenase